MLYECGGPGRQARSLLSNQTSRKIKPTPPSARELLRSTILWLWTPSASADARHVHPALRLAIQKFCDGVPHQTKAHAIAKRVQAHRKVTSKQRLKSSALKSRSHEVSRETARKTPKSARNDICGVGEVNRFTRKTPRNMAFSGVFVFGADSYGLLSWRARTYANQNTLRFSGDARP